ncbi:MAG: hypothetical protein OFPII_14530 [Osedax symbiont Rs1]|nr:MAG: hypothetical protein OFPII_14530 [Osedax symbiont Rs1]
MSFNFTASFLVRKIVGISTTDYWMARFNEDVLVKVLQGEQLAGELLVNGIPIQTCDQRQALLIILNNFLISPVSPP